MNRRGFLQLLGFGAVAVSVPKLVEAKQVYEYLIAVDTKSYPTAAEHELAHARYASDKDYHLKCFNIVLNINVEEDLYPRIRKDLLDGGCPDDNLIIADEIHAYLKTSTKQELMETFQSCTMLELYPYIDKLKAIV